MSARLFSRGRCIVVLSRFRPKNARENVVSPQQLAPLLQGASIEVLPRTAAKIESFPALLPKGTRVYIAHIDGTPLEEMVATAKRISADGFAVMPHFPARLIKDEATLADWIARYQGEAGIEEALLLAGGPARQVGELHSSIQLMESGLFDKAGFKRLHVAGHPEGNKDIDPDGSTTNLSSALHWKQEFSARTDAEMAIVTQFVFDADPVIAWAQSLKDMGVDIPIHVGVAGPAKLQTLIKFAMTCGVGASIGVLKKRAMDVRRLLLPYEPTEVLSGLAAHKAANPDSNIAQVHFFPLGGIKNSAGWIAENGGAPIVGASAS